MSATGRAMLTAALICLAASQACAGPTGDAAAPVAGASTAELRDEAVRVAEQAAVAVTSLERPDGQARYDQLLELLTGPAQQEWAQRRAERPATIGSGAATLDSVVTASGVAAFDPPATSTVLVAVTVSTAQGSPRDEQHRRLQLSLLSTPAGWKVSQLQFVE